MANNIYGAIALTGGTAGALDAISGAELVDKDMAYVIVAGVTYNYMLDADLGVAEASPRHIVPDANAGTKVWVLQKACIDGLDVTGGTNTFNLTNGTASLDVAPGAAVNIDAGLTVSGNTTLNGPASETVAGPIQIATNAEAFAGIDTAKSVTSDDLKYVLDRRLPLYYGVTWDESADTYARTGSTAGQACGVTLADTFLPIQKRMRGCLLKDDGTVNYYLSATDWTKKEDGATTSVLTGADGQVMVQIPKFWYHYGYAGTTHTYEVSPVPLAGFDPHPAFFKDGAWVDYRYIGAYEGVLYDTSLTAYVDGVYQTAVSCVFDTSDDSMAIATRSNWATNLTVGQKLTVSGTTNNNGTFTVATLVSGTKITVAENLTNETAANTVIQTQKDFTATTGDKLCSVSGFAAINHGTRAQFREIALNRGAGWRQEDYDLICAVQLLFLTEYASFYSQSVLGVGISNVTDWADYNDCNPIAKSGNGNSIGNASGNNAGSTSAATESTKYCKYRGIENFYGHLWKFVDGININDNIPYRCNTEANFADDTASNYTRMVDVNGVDVTLHNADGYVATIQKMKWGFLVASVGASGSTKITDYYWQTADWRVALFGGRANNGVYTGFACWALSCASSVVYQNISGRLGF